jgi:hypothetical protein
MRAWSIWRRQALRHGKICEQEKQAIGNVGNYTIEQGVGNGKRTGYAPILAGVVGDITNVTRKTMAMASN